jgi:hypothetical protein
MNAVEIEEAVSELVIQPFDASEFPFQFLKAFDAKDTTLHARISINFARCLTP